MSRNLLLRLRLMAKRSSGIIFNVKFITIMPALMSTNKLTKPHRNSNFEINITVYVMNETFIPLYINFKHDA